MGDTGGQADIARSATKTDDKPRYSAVPTASYRKGGRVKAGGMARLHKGERRLSRGGKR